MNSRLAGSLATPVLGFLALALSSIAASANDRCGFADHMAEISRAQCLIVERKPFAMPGSPLHGGGGYFESCALLSFSIDRRGRAWRIHVERAWPGDVAARAAMDALDGYLFDIPADPEHRYLIGIGFDPATRLHGIIPPGRTPP